ncbi:Lrp/AsnC family transcriptional regulator [Nocardiopsis composta]
MDLRILRVLQNDARITNRDLAAEVGVAASTCLDRVNRLRAAGVIEGYRLRVSPRRSACPSRPSSPCAPSTAGRCWNL